MIQQQIDNLTEFVFRIHSFEDNSHSFYVSDDITSYVLLVQSAIAVIHKSKNLV